MSYDYRVVSVMGPKAMNVFIRTIAVFSVALMSGCVTNNQLLISEKNGILSIANQTNENIWHYKDLLLFHIDVAQYGSGNKKTTALMLVLVDGNDRKYMLCGIPHREPYDKSQRTHVALSKGQSLIYVLPEPVFYHYCNKLDEPLYWQVVYVEFEPNYTDSSRMASYRILSQSNKIKLTNELTESQKMLIQSSGLRGSEVVFNN